MFLALMWLRRLDSTAEFADNQSVICPAVCPTHRLCHSDTLSICFNTMTSISCQYLNRGCILGGLLSCQIYDLRCCAFEAQSTAYILEESNKCIQIMIDELII